MCKVIRIDTVRRCPQCSKPILTTDTVHPRCKQAYAAHYWTGLDAEIGYPASGQKMPTLKRNGEPMPMLSRLADLEQMIEQGATVTMFDYDTQTPDDSIGVYKLTGGPKVGKYVFNVEWQDTICEDFAGILNEVGVYGARKLWLVDEPSADGALFL